MSIASRMLRATARFAQEWNTWGAPEMAGRSRETFVAACEAGVYGPDN